MQERSDYCAFGLTGGLGHMGALERMVELAHCLLAVPGRGAAVQQLLNLRDAQ